jgi:hypothetical protein
MVKTEPFLRLQVWCQPQQLIVWLGLQPRSQLIKMLAAGNTDEEMVGPLAQHAIQCYTQNEIAGAAQATGRDARKPCRCDQGIEEGIAGGEPLQDDGRHGRRQGATLQCGVDGALARLRPRSGDQGRGHARRAC